MSTFWKIALPFVVIALLIAGGFWFSGGLSDRTAGLPSADETAGAGDTSFAEQPATGSVDDLLTAFTTEADGEASLVAGDGSGTQSVVDDNETKDDFLNFYNENEI